MASNTTTNPTAADVEIKSIKQSATFEIIQTKTDFYYCENDKEPAALNLSRYAETIKFYIPANSETTYWGYSLLSNRQLICIYRGKDKVFEIHEPAFKYDVPIEFIDFYVLHDRWIVVILIETNTNNIIAKTHDMQGDHQTKPHMLGGLKADTNHYNIITFCCSKENYILVLTPYHIGKIAIYPDDADGITRLDFKCVANNVKLGNYSSATVKYFSYLKINQFTNPTTNTNHIMVYINTTYSTYRQFHSLKESNKLIGIINPETLENHQVFNRSGHMDIEGEKLFSGAYEYLAPDVIIHRPSFEFNKQEQYLVLIKPDGGDVRINMHEFEERKEQRYLYKNLQFNDARYFTLVMTCWAEDNLRVYQVDRESQTVVYMLVPKMLNATLHIESNGKLVYRNHDLFRKPVRVVNTQITVADVFKDIPDTVCDLISKFMKKKIIYY